MKKYYVIFLLLSFYSLAIAQNEDVLEQKIASKNEVAFFKRAFTIPFTSIYDFTSPSINIGFEQSINKRFGIQTTVGYSNNYINPVYNLIVPRNFNGAKAGLDLRYYFKRKTKINLFFTPALFYKIIIENHNDEWVSRYGGQYQQEISFKRTIQMAALTPKFGFIFLKPNKAVGFELNIGIGVRLQNISYVDFPDDAEYNSGNNGFLFSNNVNKNKGLYVRPNAFFSFALLIAGKQRRY